MNTNQNTATLAKVSLYAAGTVTFLLLLLHVIEAEFDPTWRMVSEYANGEFGLVMRVTFLLTAVATFSVAVMLNRVKGSKLAKAAAVSFFISTLGIVLAACFNQDALTTKELTFAGNMHAVATFLGIPGFAVGSLLGGLWLKRQGAGVAAVIIGGATLATFLGMFTYIFTGITKAGFVAGTYAGTWNRVVWVAMLAALVYFSVMVPRLTRKRK